MAQTIFFTGGSGFVGQHMIPVFIQAGYRVLGLARSESSAAKVRAVGATPIMDDLTDLSKNTIEALQESDMVLHSAAYMDFTYETEKFYQINVEASKQLLRLAEVHGVKRFVYISAAPVVPGSPIQHLREDQAVDGLPKDLYPRTKAIAERAILAANKPGFMTLSLRPPAIWGPNNPHMEEMLDMARAGKWVWIGGSQQILSTVHIDNLSAAALAAFSQGQGGEAYFITDGDRRSMRASFSAIFAAHGTEPGNREIPLGIAAGMANCFEFFWKLWGLTSRPPIPPILIRLMAREFSVSDEKARTQLGYRPVITFEEGIKGIAASVERK